MSLLNFSSLRALNTPVSANDSEYLSPVIPLSWVPVSFLLLPLHTASWMWKRLTLAVPQTEPLTYPPTPASLFLHLNWWKPHLVVVWSKNQCHLRRPFLHNQYLTLKILLALSSKHIWNLTISHYLYHHPVSCHSAWIIETGSLAPPLQP